MKRRKMRGWIPWIVGYGIFQIASPLQGQLAVAVVSDAAESMTNIHRFRQYALQAEQYLREVEYWVETGTQLYTVIDRLGGPNSFWVKMESLLDSVDLGSKIAGDMDWGTEWYPDDYLRIMRASNRFGHAADNSISGQAGDSEGSVGRYLDNARYFMAASVDYVNSMGDILGSMGKKGESVGELASRIAATPVSDEEGLAGIMEKQMALGLLGISSGETTNALLRTLIQSQLEEFSIEQMNQLAEWEYRQSLEEEQLLKGYQQKKLDLEESIRRVELDLERERARVNGSEEAMQRERFRLIRD